MTKFLDAKNAGDSYYTPQWCYENLPIDWSEYKTSLDAAMGDGRLYLFLEEQGIKVDGRDPQWASETGDDEDFLNWDGKVDLIITNPPFSKAQQFVEHAIPRADTVIMLQRLNWMGSQKRHTFWKEHTPDALYILSKRPSFNGKGTDNQDYAWYVWQNGKKRLAGLHWITEKKKK